jgi:hypothetical protein
MSPRAVVYLYTQTGQLREVADALTAPLETSGWDIRRVDVEPRLSFPFPWSISQFFGLFPRAVDPDELVELVEPVAGSESDRDQDVEDVVVLAYQVWYLSPSLPIRSLLSVHPELFRGRRVITLIACRNMWYSAAIEVADLLRSAGALRVEVIAASDTRNQVTSLVTTLRWLLLAKREPFFRFGRAGVGEDELARITAAGRFIAENGQCPPEAAPVVPSLAAADLLAGRLFRKWGATSRSARRFGALAHAASLATFLVGLAIGIVAGLPLTAAAALAGGRRFEAWISNIVNSQISFGASPSAEVAAGQEIR